MYIYRMIHRTPISFKSIILKILKMMGLFVITFMLIRSLLIPSVLKHEITGGYQHMKYDIQLYGGMESFLNESKEHIKYHMKINLYRDILTNEKTQLRGDSG